MKTVNASIAVILTRASICAEDDSIVNEISSAVAFYLHNNNLVFTFGLSFSVEKLAVRAKPGKITQETIAQSVGVSRATVSLALAEDPQIPEKTRQLIKKVAKELGYKPNTHASALASLQNSEKTLFQEEIAILLGFPDDHPLNDHYPEYNQFITGIEEECQSNNYSFEIYWYYDPKLSGQGLFNTLKSRNVRGLILVAMSEQEIKFNLSEFTCVHLYASSHRKVIKKATFPVVTVDEHFTFQELLDECYLRGYKRMGLQSGQLAKRRLDNLLIAALHSFCQARNLPAIPPLDTDKTGLEDIERWLNKNQPDLIIEYRYTPLLLKQLKQLNYEIPKDIGICTIRSSTPDVSGHYVSFIEIGRQGAKLLIHQLKLNLIGRPKIQYKQCIQTKWHEGKTLRQKENTKNPV